MRKPSCNLLELDVRLFDVDLAGLLGLARVVCGFLAAVVLSWFLRSHCMNDVNVP